MKPTELNRRDFSKLSVAAFGGMLAGTAIGCSSGGDDTAEKPEGTGSSTTDSTEVAAAGEKHLCRGLNACKGQGADGKNDCAGQGTCATYEHHLCGGNNKCKGQGGCHNTVGTNECAGKGGCSVPLMEGAWEEMRANFEKERKEKDLPVGAAPEKG